MTRYAIAHGNIIGDVLSIVEAETAKDALLDYIGSNSTVSVYQRPVRIVDGKSDEAREFGWELFSAAVPETEKWNLSENADLRRRTISPKRAEAVKLASWRW